MLQASEEWVSEAARVVSDGVRVLGELLGRKQLGLLSALSAVVEVRVETALLAAEKTGKL